MMVRGIPFVLVPVLLVLRATVGYKIDFFSSSLKTQALVQTHNQLLNTIKEYAAAVEELSSVLNRYTSEPEAAQISEKWASMGDPLKTFLLIRRTTVDIDSIVTAVRKLRSLDPLQDIENLRQKDLLPEMSDFQGVAKSLVRLQRMYLLKPKELVDGNITEHIRSPVKLTASDCLHIGETAENITLNHTIPVDAKMWYQVGIRLAANDVTQQTTAQLLQDRQIALNKRTKKFTVIPPEFRVESKIKFNTTVDLTVRFDYIETISRKLCRGESLRAPSMDAEIYCHLRHGPHPYMKLRPLKLEVKSQDPYLVVMHDVVGEKEIEKLKELARLENEPSTFAKPNYFTGPDDVRVSVTSWLTDVHMSALTRRIEIFLGLRANASVGDADRYQVLNYGIGGHYSSHRDYFEDVHSPLILKNTGNRIATLMFYAPSMDTESYCHLRHGPHPYMKLRPLKLEVMSQDPYLVVMHDVVGEKEIEKLKEQARLEHKPSTHASTNNTPAATSDNRVSITSWLIDGYTPSLTRRIEVFLGLKANASAGDVEKYQVLNYGIGGHYRMHTDFFEETSVDWLFNSTGHRIATLMFYLNDVEMGGYTAFPIMGIALKPAKGAAAFWWNLRTGGEADQKTLHGGCPVIYGTKWVANKWFRQLSQVFRVPCRGDPLDIVGQL